MEDVVEPWIENLWEAMANLPQEPSTDDRPLPEPLEPHTQDTPPSTSLEATSVTPPVKAEKKKFVRKKKAAGLFSLLSRLVCAVTCF